MFSISGIIGAWSGGFLLRGVIWQFSNAEFTPISMFYNLSRVTWRLNLLWSNQTYISKKFGRKKVILVLQQTYIRHVGFLQFLTIFVVSVFLPQYSWYQQNYTNILCLWIFISNLFFPPFGVLYNALWNAYMIHKEFSAPWIFCFYIYLTIDT